MDLDRSIDLSAVRDEIAATMMLAEEALDARVAAAREARTRRRPPPGHPGVPRR
jgi:hypothetical protein